MEQEGVTHRRIRRRRRRGPSEASLYKREWVVFI